MKFSLISCKISSSGCSCGLHWVPCDSLPLFCWSGTGYPFSSFPSESCTNLFLGGEWFPSLFHLLIIALGAVSVPALCVILYYLSYNETKRERERRKRKKKMENQRNQQGEMVYETTVNKTST
jgi:hypothetical protein